MVKADAVYTIQTLSYNTAELKQRFPVFILNNALEGKWSAGYMFRLVKIMQH